MHIGCDVNGNLNQGKFSAPMPWIGIYVAAASLACLVTMAADVIHGFRHWKLWFPCKFFSINATSLTLIAVAIKLSVDLNTAMPSRQDQLAKLSSSVLVCTVMGNSMPSLGAMENEEIMMNVIAFGILVITLIVNICIQLATGAIFVFWKEHAFIMFIMLILLMMLSFSALTVPISKRYLEHKYNKSGVSDYKWSTTLVLVTQTLAVGVGTIAPASRWFIAINFRCAKRGNTSYRGEFKVEKYWTQGLVELKNCPLALRIKSRHCRKLAHDTKNKLLDLCIGMQTGNVIVSKAIRLISIFFVSKILICCDFCQEWKKKFKCNTVCNDSGLESSQSSSSLNHLSCYVLHLEGEDALVEHMTKSNCDATDHWFQRGRRREPKHLIKLLEKSTFSQGFKGVAAFDNDQVPSLDGEEPPNCWALPVATLASIALALPNISSNSMKGLMQGVHEGIMYINFIENHVESTDLINIRRAATHVWLGVDLYHTWLDVDLHKLSLQGKGSKEILEELAETAKIKYEESKKKQTGINVCIRDTPSKWPVKEIAANSMYRICQTILLNYGGSINETGEKLFEVLTIMISDILGACLTNLQQVISTKCLSSTIEEREESVRIAVHILGKTERILNILDQKIPPSLEPHQIPWIDEWRLSYKRESSLAFLSSSSSESDRASPFSNDFYLSID
ncbi:hypothetical protein M0R45_024716 [Rubus argutus]|uniref:Uncharacterized protein n=1 Tax=Rubus argutus TaxID=59490 RepID=A0AAW1WU22_RUBAR